MVEAGEDIRSAAISDVTSTDSGSGGDDSTFVTAINSIILALEKAGIVVDN